MLESVVLDPLPSSVDADESQGSSVELTRPPPGVELEPEPVVDEPVSSEENIKISKSYMSYISLTFLLNGVYSINNMHQITSIDYKT